MLETAEWLVNRACSMLSQFVNPSGTHSYYFILPPRQPQTALLKISLSLTLSPSLFNLGCFRQRRRCRRQYETLAISFCSLSCGTLRQGVAIKMAKKIIISSISWLSALWLLGVDLVGNRGCKWIEHQDQNVH